ncbi:hypothetical protein O181_050290 [Austropuccinia psidii MF-1]|uniref:Uncharacterized protein n=1 Tax=Austropuccinia psidii MF-1 TaxID=1389203 RepID=A0A9Q3E0S2_9BASI|nr:hypothetical protein [Austropuccinia psidii MF-1]
MSIRSNAFTLGTWQFSLQRDYSLPLFNSDHSQQQVKSRSINGMNYHNSYFAKEDSPTQLQQMGHYWRDLFLRLGGANAARRMNNLVCMEVLGKLKMQKMNGGTEVPILAWWVAF